MNTATSTTHSRHLQQVMAVLHEHELVALLSQEQLQPLFAAHEQQGR